MSTERPRTLVIEAGMAESRYWRDIWHYRELFAFLAWRDVLVRYKQTVFGVAWAWLRPLLMMLTFTLVFGKLAKLPAENVPYAVLVFVALLPWQFFSTAFTTSATSLVDNANLVSKVYFPRMLVPAVPVVISLVDLLISAILLTGLMLWYGVCPDWRIVTLPFFLVLGILVTMGAGIWVAALNVRYRDFRFVVPFMVQLGLYVSPVGFSSSIVPDKYRLLYDLNPLVVVIDGFRWSILAGAAPLSWDEVVLATVSTFLICFLGVRYFRKTERGFADTI
jgi:lipopolysaccharide transport system permease protein